MGTNKKIVYNHSYNYALAHSETKQYFTNKRSNVACTQKMEIELAKATSDSVIQGILDDTVAEFGLARVKYITANNILLQKESFDSQWIEWATNICNNHSGNISLKITVSTDLFKSFVYEVYKTEQLHISKQTLNKIQHKMKQEFEKYLQMSQVDKKYDYQELMLKTAIMVSFMNRQCVDTFDNKCLSELEKIDNPLNTIYLIYESSQLSPLEKFREHIQEICDSFMNLGELKRLFFESAGTPLLPNNTIATGLSLTT